jgi:hypothetical protein
MITICDFIKEQRALCHPQHIEALVVLSLVSAGVSMFTRISAWPNSRTPSKTGPSGDRLGPADIYIQ